VDLPPPRHFILPFLLSLPRPRALALIRIGILCLSLYIFSLRLYASFFRRFISAVYFTVASEGAFLRAERGARRA
jgi:hypothetical protein